METLNINARYEVLERVGHGGMGQVYRALDRLTRCQVALKQVSMNMADFGFSPNSVTDDPYVTLAREFAILAALRHPYIISVLDYGFDEGGRPFYTMNLLENAQTIKAATKDATPGEKARLLIQLLQALVYLHRRRVIHRDLKPSNVLVVDDRVKVVDFGLSLADFRSEPNPSDSIAGTLHYIAPELLQEGHASVQSDLYAVGVIAYELFAGELPFGSSKVHQLVFDILESPVDTNRLGLTPELHDLIGSLLEKDPALRPRSAQAVLDCMCKATGCPPDLETPEIRESFLRAGCLVGRKQEMGTLKAALNAAKSGQGAAWLIGGESGIGKSRLLDEVRVRALTQGALVLQGQGVAGGGQPFQVWRDVLPKLLLATSVTDAEATILKPLVPDIETLLGRPVADGASESPNPDVVSYTIFDLFRRYDGFVVLLVEDLQWTDESLKPLKLLVASAYDMPLLIVGAYRNDEAPRLPQRLPGVDVMMLERLDSTDIRAFSAATLGEGIDQKVAAFIEQETEGNIFFVVETLRTLAEGAGALTAINAAALPDRVLAGGVRRLIEQRLDGLQDSAGSMLKFAAVAGRHIDKKLMRHKVSAYHLNQWLLQCEDASIIEIRDNQWRFTHDKLREIVIDRMDDEERRWLHGQVAEALEQVYPNDEAYANALAEHWYAAGAINQAADYAIIACNQALDLSEYERAQVLARRMIDGIDAAHEKYGELATILGDAHRYLGDFDAAKSLYDSVLALYLDPVKVRGDAYSGLGIVNFYLRDPQQAEEYMRAALDVFRRLNHKRGIANALNNLGSLKRYQGNTIEAMRCQQESLKLNQCTGNEWGLGANYHNLGNIFITDGNYEEAITYFEKSYIIKQKIGDRSGSALSLMGLGMARSGLGDNRSACKYYMEALTISRTTQDKHSIMTTQLNLGSTLVYEGNFAEAHSYLHEANALARIMGDTFAEVYSLLALADLCAYCGDRMATFDHLSQALALLPAVNVPTVELLAVLTSAHYLLLGGDIERCTELLFLVAAQNPTDADVQKVLVKLREKVLPMLTAEQVEVIEARAASLDMQTEIAALTASIAGGEVVAV